MAEKIIIDTDPAIGVPLRDVDDGLALGLALRSPELEVLGITVTYGNTRLPLAMRSAKKLLSVAGREDVPIYRGAASRRDLGKETRASRFIIDTLNANPGEVTLVTLGPLTNAATAELLSPGTLANARRTVTMGGAIFGRGIMPPFFRTEFNFWNDPRATSIFVDAAKELTIAPVEFTMAALFPWRYMEHLRESGGPLAEYIHRQSLLWYCAMSAARFRDGFPPHDPLAVGWLPAPEIYETREAAIKVRSTGIYRGESYLASGGAPVNVITGVDMEKFLDMFTSRVCDP